MRNFYQNSIKSIGEILYRLAILVEKASKL